MSEKTKEEFEEVPEGKYVCSMEKCYRDSSKSGKPMIVVWFRIKEGKFFNRIMFSYQLTDTEVGESIAKNYERVALEYGVGSKGGTFEVVFKQKASKNNPDIVFNNYYIND